MSQKDQIGIILHSLALKNIIGSICVFVIMVKK